MERLTDPDRWLKEYAKEHDYSAEFEPDWAKIFGQPFDTNPDFRVERGGAAVVEMRGFESGGDAVGEAPPARLVAQAGYGAFCATTGDNAPFNPRPHVSGVAVIHRHDLNAEFVSRDLRTLLDERAPETQEERERIAEEWLRSPVARGEVDGPTGYEYSVTYYDLNRYALGYGPPVPDNWFDGPRDRRFAFDSTGTVFSLVHGERQAE